MKGVTVGVFVTYLVGCYYGGAAMHDADSFSFKHLAQITAWPVYLAAEEIYPYFLARLQHTEN